jgi:replicative DNA helicase
VTNVRPRAGTGAVVSSRPGSRDTHGTAARGHIPAALAPESAYVGALLLLDLRTAHAALARVDDTDLGDYRLRVVVGVARRLVADGIPPDAVAVLARARADGTVTGAAAVSTLALLLHDLAASVPTPASVMWYAAAVLDDAVRRRVGEAAARLGQAANGESMASLLELVDREHAAVHELAARRAPAPLRAMR